MIGTVNMTLNNLKSIGHVLTDETRFKIAWAFIISKLAYGMPLILGETTDRYRVHVAIMKV